MQSIGGRTSSQQHQFQEPSQPQHSRTNKFSFQGHVRAPENTALYNIYREGEDFMAHPWQAATTANDKHLIKS